MEDNYEFLERVVRVLDHEPVKIEVVRKAESVEDAGKIMMRISGCVYIYPTIDECMDALKQNLAIFWLNHVEKSNQEYRLKNPGGE